MFMMILLVLSFVYFIWIAYESGRLRERREVLDRAKQARVLFFGGPALHMPNWSSSACILAYIAGYKPLPTEIHYEKIRLDAETVTQAAQVVDP